MTNFRRFALVLLMLLMIGGTALVRAHTPSETFLTLIVTGTNVVGRWEIAILDLQQGLKLDPEQLKALSAEEQERRIEALAIDTITRFDVKADERALAFRVTDLETVRLKGADYARVHFAATGAPPERIAINARALFGVDTNMQGMLRVDHGDRTESASFDIGHPEWRVSLAGPSPWLAETWTFVRRGVRHIWSGPDHVLFLLALLLPAVLKRDGAKWVEADDFRSVALNVVKIVTAFTIAHSITLTLGVLDLVRVPGRIAEPLIAASVIAAALNNLRPWFGERGWIVAFAFGLVHGFGFASGLLEFGLRRDTLALALVGFNLGVELGQLAIVAVFLPVAFALRRSWIYRKLTFQFGSGAVVLVAAVWMAERVFDFKVLPL